MRRKEGLEFSASNVSVYSVSRLIDCLKMRFDDVGEKKKNNMFFPRSTLHLMDWVTLTSVKEDLWWFEDMFLDNETL